MPEGLHILCKGVGSHHADFQLKLVIALGALVGHQSEPHVEPTGIGPVLGDELSCCRIFRRVNVLPEGEACPRLEFVFRVAPRSFRSEPWYFVCSIGHPLDRGGETLDSRSVGEVAVSASSKEIVFKLDADHITGIIGRGRPFPEPSVC